MSAEIVIPSRNSGIADCQTKATDLNRTSQKSFSNDSASRSDSAISLVSEGRTEELCAGILLTILRPEVTPPLP
jgi:hypothetical protein